MPPILDFFNKIHTISILYMESAVKPDVMLTNVFNCFTVSILIAERSTVPCRYINKNIWGFKEKLFQILKS